MTPLSKTILANYQVRKSKKQKTAFIDLITASIPSARLQTGGLGNNRNIIIGDVEKAKTVITAHYDTCALLPFPNFITPKNPLLYVLYNIAILLPIALIVGIANGLIGYFINDFWTAYFVGLALYFSFFFLLIAGPANKHTANDNTSGVIALCELYDRLSPQEREQTCFVFFDNEEAGLLGSRLFKKVYKKQMVDKLLINLDCVSDGDYMLIAVSKGARKKWDIASHFPAESGKMPLVEKAEKVLYPSDQLGFPNTVAIASLKHNRVLGYYMDRIHTARDTIFQEENIAYLCNCLHSLLLDGKTTEKSFAIK